MKSLDELIAEDKQELADIRAECKRLVLYRGQIDSWFADFDAGLSKAWRVQQRIHFLDHLKKEL